MNLVPFCFWANRAVMAVLITYIEAPCLVVVNPFAHQLSSTSRSKVMCPKYCKNSNESCTLLFLGKSGRYGST